MKATFDLRLPLGFAMKISAAVLVAGSALSAQVAPAPTAAVTRESVVVLSPFEMHDASKNSSGKQAVKKK